MPRLKASTLTEVIVSSIIILGSSFFFITSFHNISNQNNLVSKLRYYKILENYLSQSNVRVGSINTEKNGIKIIIEKRKLNSKIGLLQAIAINDKERIQGVNYVIVKE